MTARKLRFVGACCLLLSSQLFAAEIGVITLSEGSMRLLRGPSVMQAAEGVRIQQGDILETNDQGISIVEFLDGLLIGLGPHSRVYLPETLARAKNAEPGQAIILLAGWMKLELGKAATADGYRILTPLLGLAASNATLLAAAADGRASLFVESGTARVLEPDEDGKTVRGVQLVAGQFVSRSPPQRPAVLPRPSGEFLAAMPRGFRDALPTRPDRLKANPRLPRTDHDARYDEVEDWLRLPAAWRRELSRRLTVRLRDPAFRKAVAANISRHPEWQPVIYPPRPPHAGSEMPR